MNIEISFNFYVTHYFFSDFILIVYRFDSIKNEIEIKITLCANGFRKQQDVLKRVRGF